MKYYKTGLSPTEQQSFICHYDLLQNIVNEYLSVHVTGGSLHIILEDGNWDKSSIQFCLRQAAEYKDWIGMAICQMLLEMPDEFIKECDDSGFFLAVNMWTQKAIN